MPFLFPPVNFADAGLGDVEAFSRLALRNPFRFDTGFLSL